MFVTCDGIRKRGPVKVGSAVRFRRFWLSVLKIRGRSNSGDLATRLRQGYGAPRSGFGGDASAFADDFAGVDGGD